MKPKNKVFFILSLIFLILAATAAGFALYFGAKLRTIGQGGAQDALGEAAAGVVFAIFSVVFTLATWGTGLLSGTFCALNLRAEPRALRICSRVFLGVLLLLLLAVALSLLLLRAR